MNKAPILLTLGCVAAAATAVQADEAGDSRHHFGFGVPTTIHAKARFHDTRATNPGPNDGNAATDRFYNDGFNRVDISGNAVAPPAPAAFAINRTTYFGYQDDRQVVNSGALPNGGSLFLHSTRINGGDYVGALGNKPLPGLEFNYHYDWKDDDKMSMGFGVSASYQFFRWAQSGNVNGTVDLITDEYALGGVTLPGGIAPYTGTFAGAPGSPLIGSTPARTQATVPATISTERSVGMHALQLHLGPTFDWKPNPNWSLGYQTGLALGVGFSELEYNDQITLASANTTVIRQSGRSNDTPMWAGWFNALSVTRRLSERWHAQVGVRHTWQHDVNLTGATRSARLNFSDALQITAGVNYRF